MSDRAVSDAELVRQRSMVYDSARWTGFSLRPDDIVVSTPPKCGTTWTQMIRPTSEWLHRGPVVR